MEQNILCMPLHLQWDTVNSMSSQELKWAALGLEGCVSLFLLLSGC